MTHDIDERKRWLALIVLCLGVLMIVAPVIALTGFIVMLPQSLYQMS